MTRFCRRMSWHRKGQTVKEYSVVWRIELDAKNPVEAAQEARRSMDKYGALIFEVRQSGGERTMLVDLDELKPVARPLKKAEMPRRRYRRAVSASCAMPEGVKIFNDCDKPCDKLVGKCVCGWWHHKANVLEICRRKGILTAYLEQAFDEAILANHRRLVVDGLARGVESIVRDYA